MPTSKITRSPLKIIARFFFTRPFEITNALEAIIAVLDEYFITNKGGDIFKLYKTNKGNWFDFPGLNSNDNNSFLRQLKVALDKQKPRINCQLFRFN